MYIYYKPSPKGDIGDKFEMNLLFMREAGTTFIKPDQLDPWIQDQMKITLLSTISSLQLPNFVSCGRDKPSHMTQNLVTVGTKLWTAKRFLVDPWSMEWTKFQVWMDRDRRLDTHPFELFWAGANEAWVS